MLGLFPFPRRSAHTIHTVPQMIGTAIINGHRSFNSITGMAEIAATMKARRQRPNKGAGANGFITLHLGQCSSMWMRVPHVGQSLLSVAIAHLSVRPQARAFGLRLVQVSCRSSFGGRGCCLSSSRSHRSLSSGV